MRRRSLSPVKRRALRARSGFTLVELMVALMIFAVGALAMTATAANVMTLMTASKNRAQAAAVAEARFEAMRSTPCRHTGGSTTTRGVAETWSVVPLAKADDVTVRVTFMASRRLNTRIYRSFLQC